jgi:hypothetical protein
MATPTYTALATTTLGSAVSNVTFSSIPGSFRDIVLVYSGTLSGLGNLRLQFNSDTGSNYSYVYAEPSGSGASSLTGVFLGDGGTTQGVVIGHIMDYSATDKHKTVLSRANRNDSGSQNVQMWANRWANTSAITSIKVYTNSPNISAGTVLSLYGIEA